MSFPTTNIIDDGDRVNEGPPPSANWTTAVIDNGTDGIEINSGNFAGNGSNDNEGYWNVETFGPDSEAYVDIVTMADTLYMYLYLRLNNIGSGTSDGYLMRFDKDASVDDGWNIARLDNGTPTFLSAGVTGELTLGDSVGFEAIGADLTAYHKPAAGEWTPMLTVSDSAYTTDGYIGMMLRGGTMRVNNFGGGTVFVAPTVEKQSFYSYRRMTIGRR